MDADAIDEEGRLRSDQGTAAATVRDLLSGGPQDGDDVRIARGVHKLLAETDGRSRSGDQIVNLEAAHLPERLAGHGPRTLPDLARQREPQPADRGREIRQPHFSEFLDQLPAQ